MVYRDDLQAARIRQDELIRELAEVRAELVDRETLLERERALVAALAEVAARVEHLRARVNLPVLERLEIASPCPERWDQMDGDARARHCRRCDKNVYDLSSMSSAEATALLTSRGDLCVRFFRRADGTVMTTDCPDGVRRKRHRRVVVAVAIAGLAATGVAAAFRFVTRDLGERPVQMQMQMQGAPVPEPGPPPMPTMGTPPPPPTMGPPLPEPKPEREPMIMGGVITPP